MKWTNLLIKNFEDNIYIHEFAFNLIPQQLFCTKAKNIRESRKRNMILKFLCPQVGCVAT